MRTLICIPTKLEQDLLDLKSDEISLVCGFGLVSSGISVARAITERAFTKVILVGCAGSYDLSRWPIGTAYLASRLTIDGIGVGSGDRFESLSKLGWGSDTLTLGDRGVSVLSVTSASASPEEAQSRKDRFPDIALEEMEGFSVASAALGAGVPCTVIRGVSNGAGVRTNWKIKEALEAAKFLLAKVHNEEN